ncbi:hypothetical protein IPC1147_33620 [Pseudomonas aeruginosa]|uniref:hypothetical protein n=1 Tax=Pseudomonas aeruginosa TaxID=287 RepID=UPI000FFECB90|nr:hypothetical protein [Pseudomonas aeruginosa]MBA5106082.1 hypothetical protein [Pseudomonas aeruginosa]MBH8258757.1 hypothetical protein [Pseudomonas aeruginosa]MDP5990017.1 hypothetical protein [Pseudomonas aeruginosa]NPS41223.1 hypothetical protein [Pseudomonas aeruginosa]NPS90525.1 hypothetical protein [Pseudomonas aeruginosa]
MTANLPSLATFGKFHAGADYHGLQMVKFWFNNRRHEVLIGSANCEKLRDAYNGSTRDFERDCVSRVGTASYENQEAPTPEVVAFLNQWRRANHIDMVHRLTSQPERYGLLTEADLAPTPAILVPAFYEQGVGWVKTQDVEDAQLLAGL